MPEIAEKQTLINKYQMLAKKVTQKLNESQLLEVKMFYLLIIVQAAIYIWGVIINSSAPSGNLPVPIKIGLSLSFVLAAILVRYINKSRTYTKFVVLGMVLCFMGDLINSNVIPMVNSFIIITVTSIACFGLGHVFFIIAFVKTLKSSGIPVLGNPFYIGMIFYWAITIISWWLLVFPADKSFMSYGVLGYGLWVSTMAAFSWPLVKIRKKYLVVAAGAFMFVVSDLFLAATGIGGYYVPYRDAIIWATYVLALMGIVYSGKFIEE